MSVLVNSFHLLEGYIWLGYLDMLQFESPPKRQFWANSHFIMNVSLFISVISIILSIDTTKHTQILHVGFLLFLLNVHQDLHLNHNPNF